MSTLLALDVAILPPPNIAERAVRLNRALPANQSKGLRLDAVHLPHVTLTQQFVRRSDLPVLFECLDEALRDQPPMTLRVTGGEKSASSVWMAVERTTEISRLHERLMDVLREFERPGGTEAAFLGGDARLSDIAWVSGYLHKSSFNAFTPHITLGHASQPPMVDPVTCVAATIAACHLGRFCTCCQILKSWQLEGLHAGR